MLTSKNCSLMPTTLVATFFICCSFLFIHSNAKAQSCPDSAPPPPDPNTCPWIFADPYGTLPGTQCTGTVFYCFRDCAGDLQVYVSEVDIDTSLQKNNDCHLSGQELIDAAKLFALNDAITAWNQESDTIIHKCLYGMDTVKIKTFVPICWWMSAPSGTQTAFRLSSCIVNPGCYCTETCQVCMEYNPDDHQYDLIHIQDCQVQTGLVTCSSTPIPSGSYQGLTPGVCYLTHCDQ